VVVIAVVALARWIQVLKKQRAKQRIALPRHTAGALHRLRPGIDPEALSSLRDLGLSPA
jgi:hypothetical protein